MQLARKVAVVFAMRTSPLHPRTFANASHICLTALAGALRLLRIELTDKAAHPHQANMPSRTMGQCSLP